MTYSASVEMGGGAGGGSAPGFGSDAYDGGSCTSFGGDGGDVADDADGADGGDGDQRADAGDGGGGGELSGRSTRCSTGPVRAGRSNTESNHALIACRSHIFEHGDSEVRACCLRLPACRRR